jgi:type IV secretion system protein VirB4
VFSLLERTVDSYIPIQGHVRDGVLLLDDGSVFAMSELTGRPWETSDPRDVIEHHLRLNQTYKQIAGDTVIVSVYQIRGLSAPAVYPAGRFRSPFAASLDQAYRENLLRRTLYRNQTFIGIQVRPERYAGELIGEQIALRQKPVDEPSERRIQRLEDLMALLMTELKPYRPRRLGVRVARRIVFSEIAEAIVMAMTGRWRPIGLSTGRLGASMFSEQVVIDKETIRYLMPGSVSYGAMFGMRHFPAWTWPGMFGQLLSAPFQCTIFQSFCRRQTRRTSCGASGIACSSRRIRLKGRPKP